MRIRREWAVIKGNGPLLPQMVPISAPGGPHWYTSSVVAVLSLPLGRGYAPTLRGSGAVRHSCYVGARMFWGTHTYLSRTGQNSSHSPAFATAHLIHSLRSFIRGNAQNSVGIHTSQPPAVSSDFQHVSRETWSFTCRIGGGG